MNQINMLYPNPHVTEWTNDDLKLARRKRDAGIRRVSDNNREFLAAMRSFAKEICRQKGWVCADDLRDYSDRIRCFPSHQNAWGAIFKCVDFEADGMMMSAQVSGRGNRIFRWKLKNGT